MEHMVGRYITNLLDLPVIECNVGGVTSGVKGANKIITKTFRSIEQTWNFEQLIRQAWAY